MMSRWPALFLMVCAIIIVCFPAAAEKISDLNKKLPIAGVLKVEGHVVKIYKCPPCPPPGQCKPCMGDNIVISENNKLIDDYSGLTSKEMVIFIHPGDAEKLVPGEYYFFSVKILDRKSTGVPLNDVELVSFDKRH
ncbi:MAG: hypothetical protein SFW62_02375 [Alphaproteobacteria bacterium]|nr:hypothetical protein [Alphaproteobacteria bacterium]